MKFPHCRISDKSRVIETRPANGELVRRRECQGCGKRYSTKEAIYATARMDECAARRGTVRETKAGPAGTGAELAGAWK